MNSVLTGAQKPRTVPSHRGLGQALLGALALAVLIAWNPVLAHEDHAARHGGFVMMFLEMHFELVLPAEGGVEIYYSDGMRMAMPAAVVSDVAVEIERASGDIEPVFMQIDDSGEAWAGTSEPVLDPETIVRVAFLFQGEPFVLDIPASVFPNLGEGDMEMDMEMNEACEESCAG